MPDSSFEQETGALNVFVESLYASPRSTPPPPLFHYTSLAGLLGILDTGELWASELRSLNDAAELTFGFDLIADEVRRRLAAASDIIAEQLLDWIADRSRFGPMVFAAAFTEEGNLLSQWRGYCPPTGGVSFGLSFANVKRCSEAGGFKLGKCVYDLTRQKDLAKRLVDAVARAAREAGPNQRLHPSQSYHSAFSSVEEHMLRWCALMKHRAFAAEAEWRAVSSAHHDYVKGPGSAIRYRAGASMLVPYITLALRNADGVIPIDAVITGPTPHPARASESIQRCVAKHLRALHGPWTSQYCEIAFRAW